MGDENRAEKIGNVGGYFRRDFRHQPSTFPHPPHPSQSSQDPRWVGDENRAKKIENVGLIFSAMTFVTPSPPSYDNHRRTLEFAILNLQNFLGIYSRQ